MAMVTPVVMRRALAWVCKPSWHQVSASISFKPLELPGWFLVGAARVGSGFTLYRPGSLVLGGAPR
jgi:hypothetical protein